MEKQEFTITKVNNPEFLGMLNEQIIKFVDKLQIKGMTHQALWVYFYESIQRSHLQEQATGLANEEFWVVYDEDDEGKINVSAFAHWFKMPVPNIGKVFCDWMYSWNTAKEPAGMLMDEFIKFGEKQHCRWYSWDAVNKRVCEVFKKAAISRGFEVEQLPRVHCIGRKTNG